MGCQPLAAFSTRHRDGSRLRRHSGRTGTAASDRFCGLRAHLFVFSGEIFERGLAIWRLDIFYQERFAYTLAFAGGIVHPILFIIAGVGLLCLPPPKDGFSMR